MHGYFAFLLWWGATVALALPSEILYLVINVKKVAIATRLLLKILPVFVLIVSLLGSLAVGVAQKTPYTGFIVGVLIAYLLGDLFLCISDIALERKVRREGYIWRGFGVMAFAIGHIFLLVAVSASPQLSAGMDDGPAAPLFILLFIPVAVAGILLLAFLIYLQKVSVAEIVVIISYGFVLGSVSWRAAARVGNDLDHEYLSSQVLTLVAMLIFATSDLCILVDTYLRPSEYSKFWVMTSYWISVAMLHLSSYLFKK
jgi:hypothetical protein